MKSQLVIFFAKGLGKFSAHRKYGIFGLGFNFSTSNFLKIPPSSKPIEVPSHYPDGPGTVRVWMLFELAAARRPWPCRTGAAETGGDARIAGAAGYA